MPTTSSVVLFSIKSITEEQKKVPGFIHGRQGCKSMSSIGGGAFCKIDHFLPFFEIEGDDLANLTPPRGCPNFSPPQ